MALRMSKQLCYCPKTIKRRGLQFLRYCSETVQQNQHSIEDDITTVNHKPSFKQLLDESALMQFGRPNGKCVVGKITAVCNDDLYVDFGAKFEAVVKIPPNKPQYYEQGALVRLILKKFEMTGAFLGDPRHITLCEADAILIGPYAPLSGE